VNDLRVRWAHMKPDGVTPVIKCAGKVIAIERAGNAWSMLIVQDDGTMQSKDPADLIVEQTDNVARECAERDAYESVKYLQQVLEDQFADTANGTPVVDWAVRLLGEFRTELLQLDAERNALKAERDQLAKDLKAANKKPKKGAAAEAGTPDPEPES
jgi:hypothetical protein